jgi:uncharacterized protein (DUF1800 family)
VHLLRRAGFGGTASEIDAYGALGFEAAVDRLVSYEAVPNDALEERVVGLEAELDLTRLASVQTIWLFRMLRTAHPLKEKMTLFWHDHFATANTKVGRPALMYDQNKLLRANALGSFRTLLAAIARDPAMLRWLDGNANRKQAPNENFARELMELFTMGIGSYTEEDVREAARAFTGWFVDRNFEFAFNRNQHDFGEKTVLGQRGPWDGEDILDIILGQPATARHIAGKLFRFFVHDHPTAQAIEQLAAAFRDSGHSVREIVRRILLSAEFSSEDAFHAVVKSPVELLIGAMKQLDVDEYTRGAAGSLRRMGMDLFNPPNVAGWEWGLGWMGTDTLLERMNTAAALTTQRGANAHLGLDPVALVRQLGARTPTQIVDGVASLLVDDDIPSTLREALVKSVAEGYTGRPQAFTNDPTRVDRAVRGLVHLVMCTPVYQMA